MIYEHPLAYLLGVEGIALLRAFTGEHDREFVEARLAEIRALLADESLADSAVEVDRVDPVEGYGIWSSTYDDGPNAAFDIESPLVKEIVDALPTGVAVDAACGTGRHTALLAERGHTVIGVDGSPDMLDKARARVPGGEFLHGDLHNLPVADESADLVLCALALSHLPSLTEAFAEFARVLRPGGHLVISDLHPESVLRGSIPSVRRQDGRPGRLPVHRHLVGAHLREALRHGMSVRRFEEIGVPSTTPAEPAPEPAKDTGPWEVWPWSLAAMVPEAAAAANAGVPAMIVWHFQR
ncbi:methyltransferase family protein [Herbihabitans rhizosphaerae]|uniref:Methyltransferase family protein n=1 Tax=Herbihabitans rhizosphaerae TaxID=1872711 RepID=A0A4Q7KE08_9PSEU|nr:class I SAM-dependent methyltransferase [Herbihabitans rhizosphaerae]RZS32474.1 methyltransferase family protein [Herbihabitans rhizosphaerae]